MRIQIGDSPTTYSGLDNIQRSKDLARCQVHDRSYFISAIRSKTSEIESEIQRIRHETDSFTQDNKQYLTLTKITKDLSQKVEDLQNDLEDYNMARMNSFRDESQLKKEIIDLNVHNHRVESTIEEMYLKKQKKEEKLQRLEDEFFNENRKSNKFEENKNLEFNQRYNAIKFISNQLHVQINTMQNEVSTLEDRITEMRALLSDKQDIISLIEEILQLELRHNQLINDNQNVVASEQEQLVMQIEENNQELASIEKQIIEVYERNENLKQSSNYSIEQSMANDIQEEYNELKTHEKEIDEFSQSYEQYLYEIKNIQKTNLYLLSLISQMIIKHDQLPIIDSYIELKTNFNQYETEKQKSNDTLTILIEQYKKLKQDYTKLETLDQRLIKELEELKIKYKQMQEGLEKFNNLENLKHQAERRKQQLISDKMNIINRRQIMNMEIENLQEQFDAFQTKLRDYEIRQQLVSLEKQLQNVSQTLFALGEEVRSQSIQEQCEKAKHQALELVKAHNQWLIQHHQNSSMI